MKAPLVTWPADSPRRSTLYWITTIALAAENVLGGIWDVMRISSVRTEVVQLGFPVYFLTILGVWKLSGAVAILVPRFPRLKEWAYAGMFFNYSGAVAAHLTVGQGIGSWGYPLFVMILVMASWRLRPTRRRV
jgi:uncharacterized membrane protein YphA (DoxX/SURF4 family)